MKTKLARSPRNCFELDVGKKRKWRREDKEITILYRISEKAYSTRLSVWTCRYGSILLCVSLTLLLPLFVVDLVDTNLMEGPTSMIF